MATLVNPLREKLNRNELALGMGIKAIRTMDLGWILKNSGWDWAFIDMEHSSMTLDQAAYISTLTRHSGVAPLVRVPGYDHYLASRVLDFGALGVVFPHVDTAEQAAKLVSYCKYPPLGHRSYGGAMAQLDYAPIPPTEAMQAVNEGIVLIMMIESPRAVENANAIAAVEGVDSLLIGSNDLCLEMGLPTQFAHPNVKAAFQKVADACKKHGKWPGYGGLGNMEVETPYLQMGFRCLQAGSDVGMMTAASTERAKTMRAVPL